MESRKLFNTGELIFCPELVDLVLTGNSHEVEQFVMNPTAKAGACPCS
jgi:hypothetical protein